MAALGDLVRRARRRSGISQRELARRAGTSQAAISRIEAGLEEPGFERFQALMQSLGWQPSVELKPIAEHRAEPRRLLEERYRTPSDRVAEGVAGARFVRQVREAVDARD